MEGGGGEWREKGFVIEVDVGVDSAKSEIKVESNCGHGRSAEDFTESVREITVVDIVVTVGHHNARVDIRMPDCNIDIHAYVGLVVSIIKARDERRAEGPEEALW